MLNIHLKGKFTDTEQLTGSVQLPDNAIQFEEEDTFQEIFIKGIKLGLPVLLVMIASAVIRISTIDTTSRFSWKLIPAMLFTALLIYILTYVHEFIHAVLYPVHAEKSIWKVPDQGAYFVYCDAVISRNRFILISAAPALILGIIPYILWLVFPDLMPFVYSLLFLVTTVIMTAEAIGDFVNIYNTLRQVPKKAKVFNYGLHSYWIKNM